jgi:hypothetical protein
MRRYYALLLEKPNAAVLVRVYDDEVVRLAEAPFEWDVDIQYTFSLQLKGDRLQAAINAKELFDIRDADERLRDGAVAYVVEEGCVLSSAVTVEPMP